MKTQTDALKEIIDFDRKHRWEEVSEGFISTEQLENCIQYYFGRHENLNDFMRKNEGVLELMSKSKNRGYVFVGELQLDRNHERSMLRIRKQYETNGKRINRIFIDNSEGLSGFYWEN